MNMSRDFDAYCPECRRALHDIILTSVGQSRGGEN
jgi:hypothetical protein